MQIFICKVQAPLLSAHQPSKYEVANALIGLSLVAATVFAEANLLIGQYWRLHSRFYFAVSLFFSALTIIGFWIMGVTRRNFFADRENKALALRVARAGSRCGCRRASS